MSRHTHAHNLKTKVTALLFLASNRKNSKKLQPNAAGHKKAFRLGNVALVLLLAGASLIALPAYYSVKAHTPLGTSSFFTSPLTSLSRGLRSLTSALLGRTNNAAAFATVTQTVTISGCYYYGGQSHATVSVEVSWTGLADGNTINVSLPGATNGTTRTITQSSGANPPVVSPQVVAFEIPATLSDTVTSTATGGATDSDPVVSATACAPLVCGANDLGGTVFTDYNADGIKQAGETNGAAGVTVTATDKNGLTYTTTTNSAGRYCLAIPVANYPARVEFTNIPAEFSGGYTTLQGTDNGSSVQFVSAPDQTVDLGVNNPIDYCQANPKVLLPCFFFGNPLVTTGTPGNDAATEPSMVRFDYNNDGVEVGVEKFAIASETGPIWGIAYKKDTGHLFGAATVRRHAGLGPQGLGGIYVLNAKGPMGMGNVVDAWSVETQLGINVQDPMAPFGGSTNPATSNTNRGLTGNKFTPSVDAQAFSAVGKLGFGDIDISDDGNTLFFVNQYDKKLYGVNIANYNPATPATRPTAANITVNTTIPDPGCVNGEWRPFGTKYRRGVLYVGGVCNAITSGSLSDLRASVWAYNLTTNNWSPIFNFPLSYPKGSPLSAIGERGWHAWTDNFATIDAGSNTGNNDIVYSVPMFTDIEFDVDGTMVLGFNDRTGMQFGRDNYAPTGVGPLYTGFVGGDTLRAFFSNGTFILENNAKAGPVTGFAPNNNEGPGFGEFYFDNWRAPGGHTETTVGGLAIRPGSGEVVSSSMDPHDDSIWAAGVRYMSNSTGARTHALAVYSDSNDPASNTLGKSTGVGDVELRCDPLNYLEIGNRVWMDSNANGIQDPNEMPIQGVTVHLYRQGGPDGNPATTADNNTPVATAITNASGNYRFTSVDANSDNVADTDANLTDEVGLVAGVGLLPNTNYLIRFDRAADYQTGGALANKRIGPANAGSGAYGTVADLRDSDVSTGNVYSLTVGSFPEIVVQHLDSGNQTVTGTGDYGHVDHTFDAGFAPTPFSIGNTVFYDTNGNGMLDAGEVGKNGVLVELFYDADTSGTLTGAEQTPIARQLTAGGGYYLFTQTTDMAGVPTGNQILPGRYFVGISPYNFLPAGAPATIGGASFTAGMLAGYLSSGTGISGVGAITDTQIAGNGATDTNVDNKDDGLKQFTGFYTAGVLSEALNLSAGTEPTNETTGGSPGATGGATPGRINTVDGTAGGIVINDADSNITVDFGFYLQCLGDVVFNDNGGATPGNANNGTLDAGETGISGVNVQIYAADGTTQILVGPDGILGTADDSTTGVTTTATGAYSFCGLPQGSYVVKVSAPTGYVSSTDITSTGTPNGNVNSDDNGVGNAGGMIFSPTGANAITLTPGSAGTLNNNTVDNSTATTTNPTLDFGLYQPISIGNQVFYDTNNNGTRDGSEVGINGVTVELFADANMDGVPDTTNPLARTTTATANAPVTATPGLYLFTQQTLNTTTGATLGTPVPLPPGKYIVCIPLSNFTGAGVLVGLYSSGTTAGTTGATTETTAPDPNTGGSAGNPGIDNDDNGTLSTTGGTAGKVLSGTIIVGTNEPLTESPDNDPNTADAQENLTVDFGFYGLSVGNLVFRDDGTGAGGVYNDGIRQANEAGIAGVTVKLYAQDGTTLLKTTLTDANGKYLFAGLAAGKYYVEVTRDAALTGLSSSKDPANASTPNGADDDDNGVVATVTPTTVRTVQLMLMAGDTTATGEADQNQSGGTGGGTGFGNPLVRDNANTPDANSDLKVDFGFTPVYSLGNRIWKDMDNSGTINAADGASPGSNGVKVRLLSSPSLTTAVDANGVTVPDATTANGGYYRFDNIPGGTYVVEVIASNFVSGGALFGCASSTGTPGVAGTATGPYEGPATPGPDTNIDSDDNGSLVAGGAVRSGVVTLGPPPTTEPTGETDLDPTTPAGGAPDNASNLTVDFGFAPLMNLGNLVWKDYDNDGVRDTVNPVEPGMGGVKVVLFTDNDNSGTFNPPTDVMVAMTTSATPDGSYSFTNLLPGSYFAQVDASNFATGGSLFGCLSSTYNVTGNSDTDNNDHGVDNPNPASGGVTSTVITLLGGGEPPTASDTDGTNGNLTIDFGFIPTNLRLGNLVWKDENKNGVRDNGEMGIKGVKVNLYRDVNRDGTYQPATDVLVGMTTTDANGNYQFINLIPDPYFVRVDASNFAPGAPLYDCASSFGSVTGNSDQDNRDHGSDSTGGAVSPPTSGVVTLVAKNEPASDGDGDDNDANATVDFGFVALLTLQAGDPNNICVKPGDAITLTATIYNPGPTTQADNAGPEFTAALPPQLVGLANSCTVTGGTTTSCTVTATGVTYNGAIPSGQTVVIRYRAQVSDLAALGVEFCVPSTVAFDADNNGSNETAITLSVCNKVSCPPVGPGAGYPSGSGLSDTAPGSVLIFPIVTSDPAAPTRQNTRLSITNISPALPINVHLFFVDGATCSVSDAFICLTQGQTTSLLASEFDPGTTGYMIAIATDALGCPVNYNCLIGDEFTKLSTGHAANLGAEAVSALTGGLPACDGNSTSAVLNFDGVSYNRLPRVLASSGIGSRADGNDTQLFIDRIGGNLLTGADKLGTLFGVLYDDVETAYSFSLPGGTCQVRGTISGAFPRTTPRIDQIIKAGRTGWLKFYAGDEQAIVGAQLNFNPNAASTAGAFNGGHTLHKLRLTAVASLTIPVFPANCPQ